MCLYRNYQIKFLSLIKNKYLLARTTNIYPKAKLEMKVPTNAYDKQAPIFLKKFFLKPHEMIVDCDIELQRKKVRKLYLLDQLSIRH